MKLLGFKFERDKGDAQLQSFAPAPTESSIDVAALDAFSSPIAHTLETEYNDIKSENQLIDKYRETAMISEVDQAIEEIVSEAIIKSEDEKSVEINLSDIDLSESVKAKIHECYKDIYNMLDFNKKGHDIFRRWYIEGRINYALMIDNEKPKEGIQELRFIDAKKIKKVREFARKSRDSEFQNVIKNSEVKEYFIYSPGGIDNNRAGIDVSSGTPVAPDSMVYIHSGLLDYRTNIPLSYLHKALRPASNLRMMEDAIVIYRLTRAPERRIFYIDVGNLPKGKAEQYMRQIAAKHKNKIVYDVNTGEIKNDRRHLAMTEDYWLPRREGSRGTEIDTLAGGENLGNIEDVEYFRKKLYKSLNVPASRLESENEMFSKGTEVTRDELRFARFINRLRTQFASLFEELLSRHVVLKGIMSLEEWDEYKSNIHFDFREDNFFSEALESEILQTRMNNLQLVDSYVGRFYSEEWVQKNILKMSDDEIKYEQKKIKEEGSDDEYEEEKESQSNSQFEELTIKSSSDELNEAMISLFNKVSNDVDTD